MEERPLPSWLSGARKSTAYTLGRLVISDPWARAVSEASPECGGFFAVTNKGEVADRLVSASSPLAERIEIHAIRVVGADIKMRPLPDGLRIPAGTALTLKPRGYHLLMLGMKVPLARGASLPVTLVFDNAGSVEIELEIRATGLVGREILVEEAQRG
jgi:copper(I)-binding protein